MNDQWVVALWVTLADEQPADGLTMQALPLLDDLAPIARSRPDRIEFEFVVTAKNLSEAGAHVLRSWSEVAKQLGLDPSQGWLVSVGLRSQSSAGAEALVGVAELATMFSVSKTRARQVAGYPNFPAPVARLAGTPVWDVGEVRRYAAENRPAQTQSGV